jgi:hypothetical protein
MKKINNYKITLTITVLSLLLFSCEKEFLQRNPPTSLAVENALKTEGDLQVALRGAYAGLRGVDFFGRSVPVLGDLMGDNAYQSVTNSNRYTLYNQYAIPVTDGNADGLWAQAYATILRCNNIINSPIAANANVNQYKGEAHAIRALSYFTLVRFFAKPFTDAPTSLGVPLITAYDVNLKPARNTVQEVYALITDDLTKAYSLLTQYTNSSQFSKFSARALEAKVRLTMGQNGAALTAAQDVISNGGHTVVSAANYGAYWGSPAIRTDKVETLFEVSSDGVGNLGFDALGYIYNQSGYGDMLCADDLFNAYSPTDVRRTSVLATGTRGGLPAVFVRKYLNITTDRDDTKVLRMSDVYLIAAEASLPGNEPAARTFLDYVGSRRDAAYVPSAATGTALLDAVINERRKELAFEGDRFHDLNRLKKTVSRSTNYPASAQTIPYPFNKRLMPIPQREVDANPAIRSQQNPGY